jgi:uncharacterized membrane protein YuzA (DUF378 family)
LNVSKNAHPLTFAVIVVLCAPSLYSMGITVAALIARVVGGTLPASSYRLMTFVQILTFPWAYLIALGLGIWVLRRASKTIRTLTWVVLGLASLSNLLLLAAFQR